MRVDRDGVSLYYETDGDGETVAFVEDVGYGAWSWGWQHAALAGPFETLVWDLRGTGRSTGPEDGDYSVPTLAADLEAVLADHGVRSAHLVGSGLGGMVALYYALAYGRGSSLVLFGTSPGGPGASLPADPRSEMAAPLDDPEALRSSLSVVLSADFRRDHPDVVEGIAGWRSEGDASPDAWKGQSAAMDAFDVADRLYEVTVPALVVHGTDDRVVPVENGELLAEGLPRGDLETFEGAGHLVFVERSRPVNDLVTGFLAEQADLDLQDG